MNFYNILYQVFVFRPIHLQRWLTRPLICQLRLFDISSATAKLSFMKRDRKQILLDYQGCIFWAYPSTNVANGTLMYGIRPFMASCFSIFLHAFFVRVTTLYSKSFAPCIVIPGGVCWHDDEFQSMGEFIIHTLSSYSRWCLLA